MLATLTTAWGGSYVNDFVDRGRVKRVYVQGDAPFRSQPSDLDTWQVRGSNGQMTPFSAFAKTSWTKGPVALSRFNGVSSYEIQGQATPGSSSGEAMAEIERLHAQLEPGTTFAWSGLSYEEQLSGGRAPLLYAVSLLAVFLCLAALYESWSIPLAVLLVVPLGVIGAVLAATLRTLDNNIYLQVGLLVTAGLTAKNAILIVEFAEAARRRAVPAIEAALSAARIRFRPIIMTSIAFIAGVLPTFIATGAGAASRIALGTAVIGGMPSAMLLAVFFVPLFFVVVSRLFGHDTKSDGASADTGKLSRYCWRLDWRCCRTSDEPSLGRPCSLAFWRPQCPGAGLAPPVVRQASGSRRPEAQQVRQGQQLVLCCENRVLLYQVAHCQHRHRRAHRPERRVPETMRLRSRMEERDHPEPQQCVVLVPPIDPLQHRNAIMAGAAGKTDRDRA